MIPISKMEKNKNINLYPLRYAGLALSLVLLIHTGVLGQQEKHEEVTIIAPYRPTVSSAQKIGLSPRISYEEAPAVQEINYQIRSVKALTLVEPSAPAPSRAPGEAGKDLLRSHLRAGFGNYLSPYFELWVNSLQSDTYKAGARIRHLSSFGQIRDYAKSTFSNTEAEAYGTGFFGKHQAGGKLAYSHNMVHRYGYKPDEYPLIVLDDDDIRQVFQRINLQAGVGSHETGISAFNYHFRLDAAHLSDLYQSNETRISGGAGISKMADLFGNGRGQEMGLSMGIDYLMNRDSLETNNGGIFSATPFFNTDLSPYRINIGLQADYRLDTAASLHLYPLIRAEAGLIENTVLIYAGLGGGLEKVTYDMLSSENPYVNAILPLDYMNNKIRFYGGVKGRLAEIADFNLELSHATVENLPLFVNDSSAPYNRFDLVYDDARIMKFSGELGFRSGTDLGILFRAAYQIYDMDREAEAWHKPGLELSLEGFYVIMENLTLKANLHSRGKMYARTFENNQPASIAVDGWLDLGVGAEYRFSRQFSAFLNLNNLLNNGYYLWYQYPVQSLNLMAGIGFSF